MILYLGIAIAIGIVLARLAIKVIKWSWPYLRDIALTIIALFVCIVIWLCFKENREDLLGFIGLIVIIYGVIALINYVLYEDPKLTKEQQKKRQENLEKKILKIFLISMAAFIGICTIIVCVDTFLL